MPKFKKMPVIVDAIRWLGGDYDCLDQFCGRNWTRADACDLPLFETIENVVIWNTLEQQWLNCPVGHWVIRGVKGELYPCEDTVFKLTYEPVDV